MGSPFPPVPGTAQAPVDPTSLVGQPVGGAEPTTEDDQTRAVMAVIRQLHTMIDDVARQFPVFAGDARKAKQALVDGMVKIVSSMREEAQASPNVVG